MQARTLTSIVDAYCDAKLQFASESTRYQYRLNLRRYRDFLGREPTVDDLTDAGISSLMAFIVGELELSPSSANKAKDDLTCLWRWAAAKRWVDGIPDVPDVPEPRRVPVAWSREQLRELWDCCARQPGEICGVPAGLWWHSLHSVAWELGERIGALMAITWADVDLDARWITVRAEMRKGRREDKLSRLHETTCAMLREVQTYGNEKVFAWPYHASYLWKRYGEMLRRAKLPFDRQHKFHAIRKSAASFYEAAGGDASRLLGHSTREITVKNYLDPKIVQPPQAADVLFRPDEREVG